MSESIVPSPHDHFYKAVVQFRDTRRELLTTVLSPKVVSLLDLPRVRAAPSSFVDPLLRERFADALFICPLRDGGEVGIYTLVDHFSSVDMKTAFRLAQYVVQIHSQRNQNGEPPLPVICIVIYHGQAPWTAAMDMREWQNPPAAIADCVMALPYTLYNLRDLPDKELPQDPFLRSVFFAMKYIHSPRLIQYLPEIMTLMAQAEAIEFVERLGLYLLVFVQDQKVVVDAARHAFGSQGEQAMISAADKLRQEGRQEGQLQAIERLIAALLQNRRLDRNEAHQMLRTMEAQGQISGEIVQQVLQRIQRTE